MIEKRFTFHHDVDGIDYIQDETNGFCLICDKLLCDLLNELNKENEELKSEIMEMINEDDVIYVPEKELDALLNENKQLKSRIKVLEREVQELSCGEADWLIEEML